jgi:hypothetical protein
VTVDGESSETINGATSYDLHEQYSTLIIACTGSEWVAPNRTPLPLLHIEDQKPAGTGGGTFSSGAWRTRDLNTVVTNEIVGASLSSNQFTLPAGTYEIEANALARVVNHHMIRLQNISDSTTEIWGTDEHAHYNYGGSNRSFLRGRFTIPTSKTFELQHRCVNSGDFGTPIGGYFTVDHETYTQVWIKKVGGG